MYEFTLDRMQDAGMRVATVGTGGDLSHAPARRALEKSGFDPAIPGVYSLPIAVSAPLRPT